MTIERTTEVAWDYVDQKHQPQAGWTSENMREAFEAGQESRNPKIVVAREPDQPDYRTRLLHEYAGRAMQGMLSENPERISDDYVKDSIIFAKALIAELGMGDE